MSLNFENFFESDRAKILVILLFLFGVFLLAFGAGIFLLKGSGDSEDIKIITSEEEGDLGKIIVHVDGAVSEPGVYELESDSRVNDLVAVAGGLTTDADTSKVNLAAKLTDGQKVYLPIFGDSASEGSIAGQQVSGLINVNTASESQLDTLPSVGPVTAGKIIDARPYSAPEELLSKKAVGRATYDKIRDLVTAY